ncbi:thiamine diphosphokinase [Balneicella halophila]|uniref:Thiamine diphosphokinase n=1 Tax=Balneicella halophila TaxID=1537566 RepID=A0A7L4UQ09_BALHA|nr:thiamine diphosphokinase [Balneicella halophila]PVX50977.1 thiamine diphosphokinase [Balneicella halophila]
MKTVIVANGVFPIHPKPLAILAEADYIIACDGAADKLLKKGIEPQLIIGDLDSLDSVTISNFSNIILKVERQDNTDLMKAIEWCIENQRDKVDILGATGGRDDHSIGNIFTLTNYATKIDLILYTNEGSFITMLQSGILTSFNGQQVSLFPQPLSMKITTRGLKYPLTNQSLPYLNSGTLNQSEGDTFYLAFDKGVLLVYRTYS